MNISGLQKITLLDFPGKMAAIVFTQGCNFRCPFCQNSDLLPNREALISTQEVLDYLNLRKKILDGVVISGGEPTLQKHLKDFIKLCKMYGLAIKLDTNGSNPEVLEDLLNENLLDYIAMDIKNAFDDYENITGIKKINLDKIKRSIELIKKSRVDHEFRTTIVKGFHDIKKIEKIAEYVKDSRYFVQNFEDSEGVLDRKLEGFTEEELKEINDELKKRFPNAKVRGID